MLPGTVTSDSDLVAEMIQRRLPDSGDQTSDGRALERALVDVLPKLEGAFSFVLMDESRIIGVRDPNGFRPLCLGRLESGWVLASESPALDVVGAHFVRELDPGEMVVIDATGVRSMKPFDQDRLLASQRTAPQRRTAIWREVTYYLGSQDGTQTMRPFRRVTVYAWPVTLASIPLPAVWLMSRLRARRRTLRRRAGLCVRCGYDLRASPERCPECGLRFEEDNVTS